MKAIFLAFAAVLLATTVHAQGYDFNAIAKQVAPMAQQIAGSPMAQQVMASPAAQQAQQAVMQQALQQAAANPQLLTSMAGSLTPTQQATLMQQALTIGQKLFTPAEQAKLAAFTSSPEGASIAAKLPQLVQQLAPTVLQMVASSSAGTAPAAGAAKLPLIK